MNKAKVTKDEFYTEIGNTDTIFAPESTLDKTIWMTRMGKRVGETYYTLNEHGATKYPIENNYFLYR